VRDKREKRRNEKTSKMKKDRNEVKRRMPKNLRGGGEQGDGRRKRYDRP
jgi:ABC-type proline/glycine betaine transport system ATPase subunit